MRPRRKPGESCMTCTAWERGPGELIVGQEPRGICFRFPSGMTSIITGMKDTQVGSIINREANVQPVPSGHTQCGGNDWCQEYDKEILG